MEEESWLEDWLHDDDLGDCYLASLESLAEAWDRPEEDVAWAYLHLRHAAVSANLLES